MIAVSSSVREEQPRRSVCVSKRSLIASGADSRPVRGRRYPPFLHCRLAGIASCMVSNKDRVKLSTVQLLFTAGSAGHQRLTIARPMHHKRVLQEIELISVPESAGRARLAWLRLSSGPPRSFKMVNCSPDEPIATVNAMERLYRRPIFCGWCTSIYHCIVTAVCVRPG